MREMANRQWFAIFVAMKESDSQARDSHIFGA